LDATKKEQKGAAVVVLIGAAAILTISAGFIPTISMTAWAAVVQCQPAQTCNGTAQSDAIRGTEGADNIVARGGNDAVDARGGNDNVTGGSGNERCLAAAAMILLQAVQTQTGLVAVMVQIL
jgi:Ca2+-binding RTX toxin-like protein